MRRRPLADVTSCTRPRTIRDLGSTKKAMLAFLFLSISACTADSPVAIPVVETDDPSAAPAAAVVYSDTVDDLAVVATTGSTVTLRWTEVDDGTGDPALYRLKYGSSPIDWGAATVGCDSTLYGVEIGASMDCSVTGLESGLSLDFQLMSYRLVNGAWQGAAYSNIVTGETNAPGAGGAEPLNGNAAAVTDLSVTTTSATSVTLTWTQVDDGMGQPASYRMKYGPNPIDWPNATIGCDRTIAGDAIGASVSCTVTGLESGIAHDFQLMSYRLVNGAWEGAVYSNVVNAAATDVVVGDPQSPTGDAGTVGDLTIVDRTESSLSLRWTQVHDGAGAPASYRVKFAAPPIAWSAATVGCEPTLVGDQIGTPMSCTVTGLSGGTTYDVQLMSYRSVNGAWEGAVYSNVATGATSGDVAAPPTPQPAVGQGIWISAEEIAQLPMSGAAWNNVLSEANRSCGSVNLADYVSRTNVCVMAKALVYARTGQSQYRSDVVSAIRQIANSGRYSGLALAMGRELGAYVIAADLIGLPSLDPSLDGDFRAKLRELRTTYTSGAAANLIDCHEKRPNNWGAHCGASRMAIALYLGDTADFERAVRVFHGYLGNRSQYAGFAYGELSWQCDPARPVGINPVGCVRNGLTLDGVLPDDQRRGGTFTTSPPRENYVWEAMQGLLAQAHILERKGYPAFEWENRALLRAARWLHDVVDYPADGDDTWQPHVLNYYYGTSFPAPTPSRPGKNVGWTDWTLR